MRRDRGAPRGQKHVLLRTSAKGKRFPAAPVFLLTRRSLQVLDAFLGRAYQERTAKMADVVKGVALFTCGYALRERTHFAQVKGLVDG